jgi:flagellar basal-body rod modification protein FlgD
MINSVSNPALYGAGSSAPEATSKTNLGKNDFLTLLVTQLKNQDPLSPLQPHEFAAQLAQFSSVEQLSQLNEGMATQSQMTQLVALLSKTNFGASLIGRQVLAVDDQVACTQGVASKVRVEIGGNGGSGTLTLKDKLGRVVATRELGSLPPGMQTLTLPADLPTGTYTYSLQVKGPGDTDVPVQTYTTGVVRGVVLKDGALVLQVGDLEIPLDAITEIVSAPTVTERS